MEAIGGGTHLHLNMISEEGEKNSLWDFKTLIFELEVSGRGCTEAWKWEQSGGSREHHGSVWLRHRRRGQC